MNPTTAARASRLILMLALTFSAVSCAQWRTQNLGPAMIVGQQKPKEVLLTGKDGTQIRLKNPVVVQDSLAGTVDEERRTIALDDVDHVALRRGNPLLPALLIPFGVIA